MTRRLLRPRPRQRGATAVEFALGLIIFLTFFLGVIDFSRMLYTWGAANEATRLGARTAAICAKDSPAVLARMQAFVPQLQAANLQVQWFSSAGLDNSCTPATCTAVEVRILDLDYRWISPIGWSAGKLIDMPQFATLLPREAMGQDPGSASVCTAGTGL